eukprot:scaffold14697_cov124-Cylindrotheca_fusiformis.AAC.5
MSDAGRNGDELQPKRLQGESPATIESDEKQQNEGVVGNPRDILCGRGFHITNHHGNLQFHLLVNKYRESYRKAERRKEKQKIIRLVINETKKTGARFIRRVEDTRGTRLVELDSKKAYEKVSHALRLQRTNESNRLDTLPVAGKDESKSANSRVPTQFQQHEHLPQSSSAVASNPEFQRLPGVVAHQNCFVSPQLVSLLSGLQHTPSIQGIGLSRELLLRDQPRTERSLPVMPNFQPPQPAYGFNSGATRWPQNIPQNLGIDGPSGLQNSGSSTSAAAQAAVSGNKDDIEG